MEKIKRFLFIIFEKIVILFAKLGINRRTFGAGKIYDFFYKLFWPYGSIIEIQGSKMYVNVNDKNYSMRKTFEAYASNLVHEKATTELFKKNVKKGDIVVDLGANIGYFTLLAANLVGEKGKVFAFEPEPKNYKYLKKNIEINNYNNVIAIQKAVSSKNGKAKLYLCDYDSGHHTINKYEGIEAYSRGRSAREDSIEIETITLDDFLKNKEESIDFIKMDVEGAEALVLAGMDKILKKNIKLKMIIEFFPLLIEKMGSSPKEFIRKFLRDYQFSIFVIPEDYNAQEPQMQEIKDVDKIMSLREREEDHINLFLERNKSDKSYSKKF